MSVNKLSDGEMIKTVEEIVKVVGLQGAASVGFGIIEAEAEKVASEIENPKAKRAAELTYIRMVLDTMESAYEEEKHVHETGEEPTYDAG